MKLEDCKQRNLSRGLSKGKTILLDVVFFDILHSNITHDFGLNIISNKLVY